MPYVKRGKAVYRADTGKLVGQSNKPDDYLRVLNAVDHGWKPPSSTIRSGMARKPRRKRRPSKH